MEEEAKEKEEKADGVHIGFSVPILSNGSLFPCVPLPLLGDADTLSIPACSHGASVAPLPATACMLWARPPGHKFQTSGKATRAVLRGSLACTRQGSRAIKSGEDNLAQSQAGASLATISNV